jgi:hypothetical protein
MLKNLILIDDLLDLNQSNYISKFEKIIGDTIEVNEKTFGPHILRLEQNRTNFSVEFDDMEWSGIANMDSSDEVILKIYRHHQTKIAIPNNGE